LHPLVECGDLVLERGAASLFPAVRVKPKLRKPQGSYWVETEIKNNPEKCAF
jgi:hypothetical protein